VTGLAHGDVEAVAEVQAAVLRLARDAEEVRSVARRAAAEVLVSIAGELGGRRRSRDQARRALQACQAQENADCGAAAAALQRAEERVHVAERAYREGQQAVDSFTPREKRFGRAVHELARDVVVVTRAQTDALQGYLAGAGSDGGGGFMDAPSSARSAGGATSALPNGVHMIPLDLIDNGHGAPVTGADDFGKGYSPEDLEWAFEALHEVVLPAVQAGKGADYFSERDQKAGLVGSRSYHDTYTGFFQGDDAITLNPAADGRYTIGNGRHRIWVARKMGLTSIPARTS
jgi:hypothetical protein